MSQKTFIDQLGDTITINYPPKRIVSLVPSQTEMLASLGLDDEVVGITKFCVHPEGWIRRKSLVGGTKNFDFAIIDQLRPEVIIGNKEENYQEGIVLLRKSYPVWMSDMETLADAYNTMRQLGELTNKESDALSIVSRIKKSLDEFVPLPSRKVLYLIWRKPYMAAGNNTFINAMLTKIGLVNVIESPRYPSVSSEEMIRLNPEYVMLSSEPYPFREKHVEEIKAILPNARILLVDGEMFSWYGSRLLHAADYFKQLPIE